MNSDFNPRCPWWEVCRCTHTLCVKGWLPDQHGWTTDGNESEAIAKRCPVCDAARQGHRYVPASGDWAAQSDPKLAAAGRDL
jgi:hypothetical protein